MMGLGNFASIYRYFAIQIPLLPPGNLITDNREQHFTQKKEKILHLDNSRWKIVAQGGNKDANFIKLKQAGTC